MKIISIILYLILTVGGLIGIKAGSESTAIAIQNGTFNFAMSIKAILGFLAYIGSFLIYSFYIIKKFDLSYIYPIITGITQVLVVVLGIVLFKEKISNFGIAGIVLIILGIIFLNLK